MVITEDNAHLSCHRFHHVTTTKIKLMVPAEQISE